MQYPQKTEPEHRSIAIFRQNTPEIGSSKPQISIPGKRQSSVQGREGSEEQNPAKTELHIAVEPRLMKAIWLKQDVVAKKSTAPDRHRLRKEAMAGEDEKPHKIGHSG
ncbi:hypothetical protein MMC28_008527 [Mycoblastus sanguinarius]|nr:hypothetical protein [Mycoblastus sanguinarius]